MITEHPVRLFLTALVAVALGGCSYSDLKPQSSVWQGLKASSKKTLDEAPVSGAHWPEQTWWTAFGDRQLDDMVREALAGNPGVASAAARVRQAQALTGLNQAALAPRVDASFSDTRQRYSANGTAGGVSGTWQTLYQTSLGVGYELDFWGKNRAALEGSIGRQRAADVDRYATTLMISSAMVQAYIELQKNYDQIDLAEQVLAQQQSILDLTHRRFAAELDSQVDIKQAQASIPASKATLSALREVVELDQNRLAALMGEGPDRGRSIRRPAIGEVEPFSIPSRLPAELLGRRPDVVAQRWRVEAAGHEIDVAKAGFYPNVNLAASLGLQSFGFGDFKDSSSRMLGIGPAISLPIFDGGRLRANLASQDAAYDVAVEGYNQTLIDALHDIADQLTSLRWLKERVDQQQQAVQTANDAYDLINRRYGAGLASYIQVLIAQNAALAEQRQLVDLRARGLSLQASLSRALGGGFSPDAIASNAALTPDLSSK
ncbi:efflux transporter outer membrane subunit [Pseudomonas sp. W2-17]|uniref:efflux transporter outer membrane subunit n=1 Tax=Pseudomonas sp. W2-17 TaxID=3058039 RepID=UPI0034E073E1